MATPTSKDVSGRLVHEFLAHSYLVYLASIVIGFGLDYLVPLRAAFLSAPVLQPVGLGFIFLGTALAVWAQTASEKGASIRNAEQHSLKHSHFKFGPYSFTRTPTQYGLFLMTIGLALIYASAWMLALAIVAFLLGKLVFIRKEESHLAKKYGAPYLEYQKHVKF